MVGRLLSVYLKALDALSEHLYLLVDSSEIRLESALEDLQGGLLLQLSFLQTVEHVESEAEE